MCMLERWLFWWHFFLVPACWSVVGIYMISYPPHLNFKMQTSNICLFMLAKKWRSNGINCICTSGWTIVETGEVFRMRQTHDEYRYRQSSGMYLHKYRSAHAAFIKQLLLNGFSRFDGFCIFSVHLASLWTWATKNTTLISDEKLFFSSIGTIKTGPELHQQDLARKAGCINRMKKKNE